MYIRQEIEFILLIPALSFFNRWPASFLGEGVYVCVFYDQTLVNNLSIRLASAATSWGVIRYNAARKLHTVHKPSDHCTGNPRVGVEPTIKQ